MQFSEITGDAFPLSGGLLCGKLKEIFLVAEVIFHKGFSIMSVDGVGLRNPEQFMGLQAEPPTRVIKTVLQRQLGIALSPRAIHGLQEKLMKIELVKALWLGPGLGEYEFQFTAMPKGEGRASLGTDTGPVDARRRKQHSIRFNRNLEAFCVESVNQSDVKLEQGFAACTYNKPNTVRSPPGQPGGRDRLSQIGGGRETPASSAVRPNEIGIAELTDGRGSVLLQSRP